MQIEKLIIPAVSPVTILSRPAHQRDLLAGIGGPWLLIVNVSWQVEHSCLPQYLDPWR